MKQTVAIDFDGTIHSYTSGWQGEAVIPDPPHEKVIDWIKQTAKHYRICVCTTRARDPGGKTAVEQWLAKQGLDLQLADQPGNRDIWVTSTKEPAVLYIDDRAWLFRGAKSLPTLEEIRNFQPWQWQGKGTQAPQQAQQAQAQAPVRGQQQPPQGATRVSPRHQGPQRPEEPQTPKQEGQPQPEGGAAEAERQQDIEQTVEDAENAKEDNQPAAPAGGTQPVRERSGG